MIEIVCILFLCAAGIGGAHLWKQGPISAQSIGVLLLIPSMAAVLLFMIYCLVPDLLSSPKLSFPATVVFPVLYSTLLVVLLILVSRLGVGITRVPDAMRPIVVWGSTWVLVVNLIAGVLGLTAVGALARETGAER